MRLNLTRSRSILRLRKGNAWCRFNSVIKSRCIITEHIVHADINNHIFSPCYVAKSRSFLTSHFDQLKLWVFVISKFNKQWVQLWVIYYINRGSCQLIIIRSKPHHQLPIFILSSQLLQYLPNNRFDSIALR